MKIRLADGSGTLELKYLLEERLPSGQIRVRFRRNGFPTITLNARLGTDEFLQQYRNANDGKIQPTNNRIQKLPTIGTLRWLIVQYYGSAEFKQLEAQTQHVRRLILDKLCQSTDAAGIQRGNKPFSQMEPRNVRALRDENVDRPEAANQIVKILRQVFAYAVATDLVKSNPAKEVPYLKSGTQGFHTWSI